MSLRHSLPSVLCAAQPGGLLPHAAPWDAAERTHQLLVSQLGCSEKPLQRLQTHWRLLTPAGLTRASLLRPAQALLTLLS